MPASASAATIMDRIVRRVDFDQLKLPLGFIRLLEAVFCLIVFAAFHGWHFSIVVHCVAENKTLTPNEFTSLRIDDYDVPRCNGTSTKLFEAGSGSGTGFFAYLIAFSLFITVVGILFYLFCYSHYSSDDRIPALDLVLTVLLAVCWMIATFSFSMAARTIEAATTQENVRKLANATDICVGDPKCSVDSYAVSGTLSIATLAGVGLFLLFATNIWFVYKETHYFRERQHNMHRSNLPATEPYTLE